MGFAETYLSPGEYSTLTAAVATFLRGCMPADAPPTREDATAEAMAVVAWAVVAVEQLVQRHQCANFGTVRGMVFEVHHVATFNLAAICSGSTLRAEQIEQDGADIRISDKTDPRVTGMAQLKSSPDPKRWHLGRCKYDGKQKIVPKGLEAPVRGIASAVSYGKVQSTPLSVADAVLAVRQPVKHFTKLMRAGSCACPTALGKAGLAMALLL